MSDIPQEAVQAAAEALGAHPWNSYPHAAHGEHNFDSACAVCRADLEPIARVVLEAAADALADAGLVVVSAGEHERLRKAEAAIARVRRLCDLTIAASCRVHAIDQARDTLAVLDDQEADGG